MNQGRMIDRRGFLRQTATTVAAVGVPALVSSKVLGQNAPSKLITMGFIGTGKQSKHLMGAFLNEKGTQVLAGCDVDKLKLARSKDITEKYYADHKPSGTWKGYECYGDFRKLLERQDIDAVVISTPDHWHSHTVIHSARAGKDIYCEKPLANSIGEAQAMVKEVRRMRRVFQTGSMQRSDQKFRHACELVRNGYIGDIVKVNVNVGGPPRPCDLPGIETPEYLDWEMWLGPAPLRPYHSELSPHISWDGFPHWRSYKEYGGGGMTDWGAHHFDIAQWGLGMDGSGPVEIIPPDGKDIKVLTYKYANGVICVRDQANGILFTGTKGTVEVNRGYLKTNPESLTTQKIKPNEIRLYESNNHYRDFLDAVRTRSKPICDIEIGASTVIMCHLGINAYELGRPIKWDPKKQDFIDDPEAERLRTKPMRAPWRL